MGFGQKVHWYPVEYIALFWPRLACVAILFRSCVCAFRDGIFIYNPPCDRCVCLMCWTPFSCPQTCIGGCQNTAQLECCEVFLCFSTASRLSIHVAVYAVASGCHIRKQELDTRVQTDHGWLCIAQQTTQNKTNHTRAATRRKVCYQRVLKSSVSSRINAKTFLVL